MDREILRLELLKLTYAHSRQAAEAVERAKELEAFVVVPENPAQEAGKAGAATGTLKLPQKQGGPIKQFADKLTSPR